MSEQLRPRTDGERRAYLVGYANGILDVRKNPAEASRWLATMAVAENMVTQEEVDAALSTPEKGKG